MTSSSSTVAISSVAEGLVKSSRIENLISFGFLTGGSLLLTHGIFGAKAKARGGRAGKVAVELQRKAFHMIGGCIISSIYHYGVKLGWLTPANTGLVEKMKAAASATGKPIDAALVFTAGIFVSWIIEASRILVPAVQRYYLKSFKGLIREKEMNKAAGIAYFLPGALAAMMSADRNLAVLGVLFLSIGDAASSLGTAAGSIPVGSSKRKVEGSIACFSVCSALGAYAGLPTGVAATTAGVVTVGEVLAEVIGLDDNFVLPILTVLGVRLAYFPNIGQLATAASSFLAIGVLLGMAVGATTPEEDKHEK